MSDECLSRGPHADLSVTMAKSEFMLAAFTQGQKNVMNVTEGRQYGSVGNHGLGLTTIHLLCSR